MFKENGSYQFDDKVLTDYLSTIWSMATEHLSDSVIVRFLLNNASRLGLHEDVHIELNRQERDNLLELSLFVLYRHLLHVSSDLRKLPLGVHPYTFTRFQQLHFEQSTYRDKQALPPDDRAMALGSDGVRPWRSYTFAREYSPEKLLRLAVKERKQEKDDSIQILFRHSRNSSAHD